MCLEVKNDQQKSDKQKLIEGDLSIGPYCGFFVLQVLQNPSKLLELPRGEIFF